MSVGAFARGPVRRHVGYFEEDEEEERSHKKSWNDSSEDMD